MKKKNKTENKMLDVLKIVIIIFTISVLTVNVTQADKPECKKGCSPAIISYNPPNLTIYDNPPANETFSITVNQTVDVTWFFDGAVHKTDNSVNASSDTIDTNLTGVHNVTAVAQNGYGLSVSQTWTWSVYPPPQIVYYEPTETILNSTEARKSFRIRLDQDTYVTLCWSSPYTYPDPFCWPPSFVPAGVLWGQNISGDVGTNIITSTASNNNGTVSKEWIWNVTYDPLLHPPPNITQYDPETPLNITAPTTKMFQFKTDMPVNFTWCRNGVCEPTREDISSSYCQANLSLAGNGCQQVYTFNTSGTEIIVVNVSTRDYTIPVYANQTWIVNVS